MTESRAARCYTRYAGVYDRIATDAPFVAGLRERVADALALGRGDVVVEMGCGTGANFPVLRDRVGPGGTVIGLDVSAGVVERARTRIERAGWRNVHVARADATRPPLGVGRSDDGGVPGEVDAVLATFVTGMLADPAAAVDDWCRLVADAMGNGKRSGSGADVERAKPAEGTSRGRVCVAGFARSTHPIGRVANPAFGAVVRLAAPPGQNGGGDRSGSPIDRLDERALAAHRRVHDRCSDATTTRWLAGFARITAGTVGSEGNGTETNGPETVGSAGAGTE